MAAEGIQLLVTTTSESTAGLTSLARASAGCNNSIAEEPAERLNTSHWEKKYRVKYKVKQLMGELMEEGPLGCSTPRQGYLLFPKNWFLEMLILRV